MHEIRHTLGTLASKSFPARMVQAVMGVISRNSLPSRIGIPMRIWPPKSIRKLSQIYHEILEKAV